MTKNLYHKPWLILIILYYVSGILLGLYLLFFGIGFLVWKKFEYFPQIIFYTSSAILAMIIVYAIILKKPWIMIALYSDLINTILMTINFYIGPLKKPLNRMPVSISSIVIVIIIILYLRTKDLQEYFGCKKPRKPEPKIKRVW